MVEIGFGIPPGGVGMAAGITLFALLVFALGSTAGAYAWRKMPIAFVAAAAWAVLAFFAITQSDSSNPTVISDYWMAIFWVGIAMVIVSVFEPVIMRQPEDKLQSFVDPDGEKTESDRIADEYTAIEKEMGVFKPRSRKHRRLRED